MPSRDRRVTLFESRFRAMTIRSVFHSRAGLAPLFQRLVRLCEANDDGFGTCYTCGSVAHFSVLQAGHYVSRTNLATVLLRDNCHSQCVHCNYYLHGNLSVYKIAMIREYGRDRVKEIENMKLPKNNVWDMHELAEQKVDLLDAIKREETRLGIAT